MCEAQNTIIAIVTSRALSISRLGQSAPFRIAAEQDERWLNIWCLESYQLGEAAEIRGREELRETADFGDLVRHASAELFSVM